MIPQERIDAMVAVLREAGTAEAQIVSMLEEAQRHDAELDAGRCPRCAAPVVGRLDGARGAGPIPGGVWTIYPCTRCGHVAGRQEVA